MNYEEKYLKYKEKYNNLKNLVQKGGDITRPWDTNSNLLYIAAVIDINSDVGKEIEHRSTATGNKAYSKYGSGKLHCPHISLLQIFIKESTDLDNWIKTDLDKLLPEIIKMYNESFDDIQIHSSLGHYNNLGGWCVRNYDDNTEPDFLLDNIKIRQQDFRRDINYYLLLAFIKKLGQPFKDNITVVKNLDPHSPSSSEQKFTHFSIKPSTDTVMAEGSFVTDRWDPHVSLLKTTNTNYQDDFKSKASGINMSWISLWGSKETKVCSDGVNRNGTIGYIFVSYAGNNIWIPI